MGVLRTTRPISGLEPSDHVNAKIIAITVVYGSMMKSGVVVPTKLLSTPIEKGRRVQAGFENEMSANMLTPFGVYKEEMPT